MAANSNSSTGPVQPRPEVTASGGHAKRNQINKQNQWDQKYGDLYNADGTLKATDPIELPNFPEYQGPDVEEVDEPTAQFNAGVEAEIIDTQAPAAPPPQPEFTGSHIENWLSTVNLGTYKWTFYLVKPELFNNPLELENDDAVLNRGDAVVISETGVEGTFVLDNMLMLHKLVGGTGAVGTFQFTITEPISFTFMDRLTLLQPDYYPHMGIQNALFVLKLEFLGRDSLTDAPVKWPGKSFFYPCTIREIQASVGPEGSQYNIVAFNTKYSSEVNSVVISDISYEGVDTVANLAQELQTKLNTHERELRLERRNQVDVDTDTQPQPRKYWEIVFEDSTSTADGFKLSDAQFSSTGDQADAAMLSAGRQDANTRDGQVNNNTNMKMFLEQMLTANCPGFTEYAAKHREQGYKIPFIHVDSEDVKGTNKDGSTNERELTTKLIVEIRWNYTTVTGNPDRDTILANDPNYQRTRANELPIKKVYRYLHSGETTELLNFDLTFDNYFFNVKDPGGGFRYEEMGGTHPGSNVDTNNEISASPLNTQNNLGQGSPIGRRYLSDIKIDQDDMATMIPLYGYNVMGGTDQRVTDIKNTDPNTVNAIRDRYFANRDIDFQQASFEIRGDPFWMGVPSARLLNPEMTSLDYGNLDAMVGFLNYLGNEDMLTPGYSRRADMDLVSSGVYKITDIESKFQGGRFTQILKGYKDNRTNPSMIKNKLENL